MGPCVECPSCSVWACFDKLYAVWCRVLNVCECDFHSMHSTALAWAFFDAGRQLHTFGSFPTKEEPVLHAQEHLHRKNGSVYHKPHKRRLFCFQCEPCMLALAALAGLPLLHTQLQLAGGGKLHAYMCVLPSDKLCIPSKQSCTFAPSLYKLSPQGALYHRCLSCKT